MVGLLVVLPKIQRIEQKPVRSVMLVKSLVGCCVGLYLFISDLFRQYFTQLRQETGIRLVDSLINDDGTQNKYWFSFQKRKFMVREYSFETRKISNLGICL